MKDLIATTLLGILIIYIAISSTVFKFRHPKANDTVLWTHFGKVITFGTVKEFRK